MLTLIRTGNFPLKWKCVFWTDNLKNIVPSYCIWYYNVFTRATIEQHAITSYKNVLVRHIGHGKMQLVWLHWEWHDDVIKWKHFPRHWPFVRGIHRSPMNSPHKGQWRGALMFSLICARLNGWVNNREAGDLRRHGVHYDITVMGDRGLQLLSPV